MVWFNGRVYVLPFRKHNVLMHSSDGEGLNITSVYIDLSDTYIYIFVLTLFHYYV